MTQSRFSGRKGIDDDIAFANNNIIFAFNSFYNLTDTTSHHALPWLIVNRDISLPGYDNSITLDFYILVDINFCRWKFLEFFK